MSENMLMRFSAVLMHGPVALVALCPELGVVSQGKTKKEALTNLKEAIELFLEDEDVQRDLKKQPFKKAEIASIAVSV